jgi:ABC-type phosphate transport system ATPase subunit
MEMSSRFIWEQVNPFIMSVTDNRCYVEKVESIEHDSNSAYVEVTEDDARAQANVAKTRALLEGDTHYSLVMKPEWEYKSPKEEY